MGWKLVRVLKQLFQNQVKCPDYSHVTDGLGYWRAVKVKHSTGSPGRFQTINLGCLSKKVL